MIERLDDKTPFQIFGERLKTIRRYLQANQNKVAKETGLTQLQMTRLETGNGGTALSIISLLNYYSQFVYIDTLFNRDFTVIGKDEDFSKTPLTSLVVERMKIGRVKFGEVNTLLKGLTQKINEGTGELENVIRLLE
jgi:transcriptional regulator with XRE-family HTH domain